MDCHSSYTLELLRALLKMPLYLGVGNRPVIPAFGSLKQEFDALTLATRPNNSHIKVKPKTQNSNAHDSS